MMRIETVKCYYHRVVLVYGRDGIYRAGIPVEPEEPGGTCVRDARRWVDLGEFPSVSEAFEALVAYVDELEAAITCAV